MADLLPDGPVSVALAGAATLIANLAWFQTWTGTNSSSNALSHIFLGDMGYPAVSMAISGGVLTVTTREPHNFLSGQTVTVEGVAIGAQAADNIDGPQTITGTTSTTFTCSLIVPPPDTSTFYPDGAFILPCSRPLVVLMETPGNALAGTVVGTGGAAVFSGKIDFLLEADVSSSYANDPVNAPTEANNAFGGFVQSLLTTQGTEDYIWINDFELITKPEFTSKSEQDDGRRRFERWRAAGRIAWGLS